MRKLLLGGGIMLAATLSLTAFAKPTHTLTAPVSTTNDLADRLAADEDFKSFSITTFRFISKIKETKSGKLFSDYFNHKISEKESKILLANLEFTSEKEFQLYIIDILKQKHLLDQKFAELKEFQKYHAEIRLARDKTISPATTLQEDPVDCYNLFFALTSIWSTYCATVEDWSSCWIQAMAAIGAITVGCLIFD